MPVHVTLFDSKGRQTADYTVSQPSGMAGPPVASLGPSLRHSAAPKPTLPAATAVVPRPPVRPAAASPVVAKTPPPPISSAPVVDQAGFDDAFYASLFGTGSR
jgi:hypothetical protein